MVGKRGDKRLTTFPRKIDFIVLKGGTIMAYLASEKRYETMEYRRWKQRIKAPLLSLGLWHNFGGDNSRAEKEGCSSCGI